MNVVNRWYPHVILASQNSPVIRDDKNRMSPFVSPLCRIHAVFMPSSCILRVVFYAAFVSSFFATASDPPHSSTGSGCSIERLWRMEAEARSTRPPGRDPNHMRTYMGICAHRTNGSTTVHTDSPWLICAIIRPTCARLLDCL